MSTTPRLPVALVLLAAGRSRRYGSPKQLDPVGPGGATLMDYAVADAASAGVGEVVVVASSRNRDALARHLQPRWGDILAMTLVEQQPGDLPPSATDEARAAAAAGGRPLGTVQAVWAARHPLAGRAFLVANADDYYGPDAYRILMHHLEPRGESGRWALAGYRLADTLSAHGGVNRGVCRVDVRGRLVSVFEGVGLTGRDDRVVGHTPIGEEVTLAGDQVVSMNLWAFTPDALAALEHALEEFVEGGGIELGTECLLPAAVEGALKHEVAEVDVLPVPGPYYGLTHPQDRPGVVEGLRRRGPPPFLGSTPPTQE